jgi:hypothetical protein
MTFVEIVQIGASVIVSLGGAGAIVLGLSNYLGKVWADRALEKQRQEHTRLNLELTHQLGLMTEQVRNSLQMAALEHQVRFSKLHEKRAEVIVQVYEGLVEARLEGKRFIAADAFITDPKEQQEALRKVRAKMAEVSSDIQKRRIYLPEHICALLQKLSDDMWQYVEAAAIYAPIDPHTEKIMGEKHDVLLTAYKAYFSEDIPAATKALEDEFRKLLGVETSRPV